MSLGRGLGALIASTTNRQKKVYATGGSSASGDIGDPAQKIWLVPLSEISPNPKQPRQHFSEEGLKELADSIKTHGILQPLILSEKSDGGYEIIAGERRWRAARLAGLATVPAMIKVLPEQAKLEVSLIENLQREDLNPVEEAFAYKRLRDEFGLSNEAISAKVGKSSPVIINTMRLLTLPEEALTALIEGRISRSQARALLGLKTPEEQLDMFHSMFGKKITSFELEREVRKRNPAARRDPNVSYLEEKLREKLGTKVSISQKGERGTISISYFSREELKKLIEKISGESV